MFITKPRRFYSSQSPLIVYANLEDAQREWMPRYGVRAAKALNERGTLVTSIIPQQPFFVTELVDGLACVLSERAVGWIILGSHPEYKDESSHWERRHQPKTPSRNSL